MRVSVLMGCLLIMMSGWIHPAWAQDKVTLRTSNQDEYSRLVFVWPAAADYVLEKPDSQTVIVKFKKAAALDSSLFSASSVPNIENFSVLASDPLSVLIKIPDKSRVRDLSIGNRVVIDVFTAPGSPQKPKAEKTEISKKPPEEPSKTPPVKATPTPAAEKVAEKKEEKTVTKQLSKLDTVSVQPATQSQTIKLKTKEAPTMVLLSSTHNFGLAAFELNGKLFLGNDKSDLAIKPQLSGPQAGAIKNIESVPSDTGSVFAMKPPEGMQYKGQGGGLVWRVLFSPETKTPEGTEPRRVEPVAQEKDRGGKIVWPLQNARSVLSIKDPQTGQAIKIVTVEKADQSGGPTRQFVEFDVLNSPIGLAIVPKVDDLEIKVTTAGVEISRPGGLTLAEDRLVKTAKAVSSSIQPMSAAGAQRLYDFKNWQLGGLSAVNENRTILLENLNDLSEGGKSESLLTLAKMYLSNGMGHEAQGVLRFAITDTPLLADSPEFKALQGAAEIISGHFEEGLKTLSLNQLEPFIEIKYWKAAALAGLGDWQQAIDVMPQDLAVIDEYPPAIENRLAPVFAEIALRAGNVEQGKNLLAKLEKNAKDLSVSQAAALVYLKGEAARQAGKTDETKKLWQTLIDGKDDLYRVKAGLALARLLVDKKELTPAKAIDSLERLRYAWRGDDLEAHINAWLGRTYFESGDYIKGLKIMREAAIFVPETALAQRITGDMSDLFIDLFVSEKLDAMSPLDAVAAYNEFSELIPLDERGDRIVERLAEHLVKSDLLGRAADLLDYQIKHRLSGEQAYTTGVRLAAIRLLDSQPEKALAVLNMAQQKFSELPEEMKTPARVRELSLLRARALSRQGRPDQALEMLRTIEQTPDVNRLRADIAWTAGYWDDASEALGDVLLDQNISLTKPPDEKNTGFILQRAIALNLASDRIALADMRTKYTDLMNQTPKGKIFEVITRTRQSAALSDRETLLSVVSEVDLFSDFLNSYKSMQAPEQPKAPAPAAPATPPAAQPTAASDQSSGSTSP